MKFDSKRFIKEQALQAEQPGEIELSAAELVAVVGGGGCPEGNGFSYGGDPYPQGYGYNYGGSSCYQGYGHNYGGGSYPQGYGYNYGGDPDQGYGCHQSVPCMIIALPSACSY